MKKIILSFVFVAISMLSSQLVFADNPLLINGQPLNYEYFSIGSKGILTMIIDDSKSKDSKTIPFKVYLRRDKKIVHLGGYTSDRQLSEIEISEVLKFANLGDELVIEPVDKKYYTSTRVFFLRNNLVKFISNFIMYGNKKDGC
jgi:hypothetical protein